MINYLKRGVRYVLKGELAVRPITKAQIVYSSPSEKLKGKKIIVTGGGRGLGFAMAKKFKEEGAEVLIAGRNEETLLKSSNDINCKYLTLDVTDVSSFTEFITEAEHLLGGVNCLVNNAGISLHESSFKEVTVETFDKQINTNLRGGFFLTQRFVQLLESNHREGNIIFISSETGETVDNRPYGWTKAAVNSMMRGFAYQLAKENIRVNAIAPGVTTSDMTGFKEDGNIYYAQGATKRVYLPGEVAETATFLLSDISGCISGQVIVLNNGKTINFRK